MLCYYGLLLLPNSSMANGCRQGFTRRSPPLVSSDRFLCLLRRNAGSVRMKRPRSSMLACSLSNVPSLDTSSITHHGLHPSPFSTATNDGGENPKEEDVVAAGKIRNMTAETQALAAYLLSSVDHPDQEDIISSHDTSSLSSSLWKHRAALSKAITLIESRAPEKQVQASLLLTHLMRHANHGEKRQHSSFRIGIAGPVGAGKSTFVEALGHYILNLSTTTTEPPLEQSPCSRNNNNNTIWTPRRLAVVCIDPSSYRTGGSILGDKTRMTRLAVHPRAFVRPSPAQGVLGGLAPRTDDVVRLLAQQYPLTIVETVGLGQSELEVKETVDLLILVVPPGGGDQLQGVKKGIVEVADMIVVTKADGDLLAAAKHTAADYRNAMNFLHGVTAHLRDAACGTINSSPTEVLTTSARNEEGLDVIWQKICQLRQTRLDSGQLETRRREQRRYWMWKTLQTAVLEETEKDPLIRQAADHLLNKLDSGDIPPRVAAAELLQYFIRKS